MAKTFDLGNTLADVLKNASDPDRGPEQIVLLPIANIDADANNFYSMDGVEELAANIELIGLLDPLRVRENPDMPGRYLIVSGHRRRAALWTLYESEPEKWAKAPCIIEPAAASPELQELRLIYANADTRRMSSADLSAQAERVEMLLYKLKDQGMEFPGRMRDHVAEACKVSATRLAQLKVIREKLIDVYRLLWDAGKLNETCAYTLAKAPKEVQRRVFEEYGAGDVFQSWPQWQIENAIATVQSPRPEPAKTAEPSFDAEKYEQQMEKERRLLRRAIKEQWLERLCGNIARGAVPQNRMEAIDRLKRCYRHAGTGGMKVDYDGAPNGLYVRWQHEAKFLARYTDVFDQLALVAIDELQRRFEEDRKKLKKPVPAAAPQQDNAATLQFRSDGKLEFRVSDPPGGVLCWCCFEVPGGFKTFNAARFDPEIEKWRFKHGETIDALCLGWYPLPE